MSILYNDKSGATPQAILLAGNANTDQILNGSSKNAIANKAVYNALADKIDKAVTDLINYYDKSQTYNKAEIRAMVDTISTMDIKVVNSLPVSDISTTTIYFLKQSGTNNYDEYLYIDNAWVKIGDTSMDLSQYLKTADFNVTIANYYNKSQIDYMINNIAVDNLSDIQDVDVSTVADGETILWDDTNSKWVNGPAGKTYTGGDGIEISNTDVVSTDPDVLPFTFVGTTAEWNALTAAEKAKYPLVNLTDDAEALGVAAVDSAIEGDMRPVTSNALYNFIHIDTYNISTNASGWWKTPFHVNDVTILRATAIDKHIFPFVGSDKYWYIAATGWTSPGTILLSTGPFAIDLVYFYRERNV